MATVEGNPNEEVQRAQPDHMDTEITALKNNPRYKCKIISSIGDFLHIVDIKFAQGPDVCIKFQLEKEYPRKAPNFAVVSDLLNEHDIGFLHSQLSAKANSMIGQTMLESLLDEAEKLVNEKSLGSTVPDAEKSTPSKSRRVPKQSKQRSSPPASDESSEKGSSMKTAEDVISRIMWDAALRADNFKVGYLDRFVGVVEKSFAAFEWQEDIASVDYNTLAIPQHRIQYFKYGDVKVWDKNERLDDVFGSTGSRRTIYDVMKEVDAENVTEIKSGLTDARYHENIDDDDDDDDDIEIITDGNLPTIIATVSGPVPFVSKKEKYWGAKIRPTHFLALRVIDPEVRKLVVDAQETFYAHTPEYKACSMPSERLHMTFCCLGLDTPDHVTRASDLLFRLKEELERMAPKEIRVEFEGTDQFYRSVLYAKVKKNVALEDFVNYVRLSFRREGIEIRDLYEFTPHMTLLKISKAGYMALKTPYLNPQLCEAVASRVFGSQILDNIHLCQMSEERSPDGFYVTPAVINF